MALYTFLGSEPADYDDGVITVRLAVADVSERTLDYIRTNVLWAQIDEYSTELGPVMHLSVDRFIGLGAAQATLQEILADESIR